MALPKPPKDYYTLEEVAHDWGWTVDDLWWYAEKKELQICVLLKWTAGTLHERVLRLNDADNLDDKDRIIRHVILNGPYPISISKFDSTAKKTGQRFITKTLKADLAELNSITLPFTYGMTSIPEPTPPSVEKRISYRYVLDEPCHNPQHVITHEEKKRFRQVCLNKTNSQDEKHPENQEQETEQELVNRQKQEGKEDGNPEKKLTVPQEGREKSVHKTDVEMAKRLKKEGLEPKKIAQQLKNAFPKITPSRIGRLITEEPGVYVTTDAYRKRGIRLLE